MRLLAAAVIAAITTGLAAGSAAAECAMPRGAIFPKGQLVAPNPRLYRFEPKYGPQPAIRMESGGAPIEFRTEVHEVGDMRVTRLDVAIADGELDVLVEGERARRYVVGEDRAARRLSVARVAREQSAWTCSHTDGIAIELHATDVAAFEVRWTGGATAIVAPSTSAFFATEPDASDAADVFLGHENCVGDQIPPRLLGRRDFTLTAIYTDGRRRQVTLPVDGPPADDTPAQVEPPAPPPSPAPPPAPPAEEDDRPVGGISCAGLHDHAVDTGPDGLVVMGLVLGSLLVGGGIVLARRRRTRPTRVP